ncbi:MAG: FxsA family protein [Gallionellaceae bacterium]
MLFFILLFPALEIYTMFQVADVMGWWLLAWLILSALTGWILMKEESMAIFGRLAVAVQNGQSPIAAVWDSGRTMLAALLLIFPGVLSDLFALVLLLLPNRAEQPNARPMPDDDTIEGEVRVIEAEQIESKSKNQ